MRPPITIALLVLAISAPSLAQTPRVTVGDASCLPLGQNSAVTARVEPEVPGMMVRLYFRRLHNEVEDFYYVEMRPSGNGNYWAVLPRPADPELKPKKLEDDQREDSRRQQNGDRYRWAEWWRAKEADPDRDPNDDLDTTLIRERAQVGKAEKRAWLDKLSDADLQRWLEGQEYEPTEYFAAIADANCRVFAKSEMKVAPVTKDCDVTLNAQQQGLAESLTIGETAAWQRQEEEDVFHWQCEGIVARIDNQCVQRLDEHCNSCVVAWWQRPAIWVPAAVVGGGILTGIIITDDDPEASRSRP